MHSFDTLVLPYKGPDRVRADVETLICALPHRWEAGDLNEWSAITYPDKLHEYVTEEFRIIKKRQADLLGIKEGIRSKL